MYCVICKSKYQIDNFKNIRYYFSIKGEFDLEVGSRFLFSDGLFRFGGVGMPWKRQPVQDEFRRRRIL